MDALDARGIPWDVTPGVSSFCGAAAAAGEEYTLPGVSQSVIITRMAGRTPVPEGEDIASLAAHGATMVIFLSAGMLEALSEELQKGAYTADTPAALVYKATWPEEKVVRCTVGTLAQAGREHQISKTALVLVGVPRASGKSDLACVQICDNLCRFCLCALCLRGGVGAQIKLRAERLHVRGEGMYLLAETNLEDVLESVNELKPDVLIVDSIQTLYNGDLTTAPGSVGQVKTVLCADAVGEGAGDHRLCHRTRQ